MQFHNLLQTLLNHLEYHYICGAVNTSMASARLYIVRQNQVWRHRRGLIPSRLHLNLAQFLSWVQSRPTWLEYVLVFHTSSYLIVDLCWLKVSRYLDSTVHKIMLYRYCCIVDCTLVIRLRRVLLLRVTVWAALRLSYLLWVNVLQACKYCMCGRTVIAVYSHPRSIKCYYYNKLFSGVLNKN